MEMARAPPSESSHPHLSLAPPPTPRAQAPKGPHSQVFIQVVIENGPQLKLLKAADRDGQAEVQVKLAEHSEMDWCSHTQT